MTELAAPEYVAARGVLLDALEALAAHQDSLILVGAQAVYLHTGPVPGTGIQMTTDSDLAIDADLLAAEPELTATLAEAHFNPVQDLPGQWENPRGIRIDLMTVPHQSNRRSPSARAASLPPHGRATARITPGLEPALVDNVTLTIPALADDDDRRMNLKVAGPAALLTAKLVKLHERHDALLAGRGSPARLRQKDVLDCHRLLLTIETDELVAGFEKYRPHPEALKMTRRGMAFLAEQHHSPDGGVLRRLLADALPEDAVALAAFGALCEELLDAMAPDFRAE